jgi:hypothetical protein
MNCRTIRLTVYLASALLFATVPTSAQHPGTPSGPLDAIAVIADALRATQLVALGEVHGSEQGHAFRVALLHDTRVIFLVNDIVVEFGNGKYQDLVDAFVGGRDVPDAELRHVWQDTTQISGVWDRPVYADFFQAVREINRTLPANHRFRVLLADPPVDWDVVRRINEGPATEREGKVRINGIWVTKQDAATLDRDAYAADLVRREVIDKGRRGLLIFGEMHVRRLPNTVVSRIEASTNTHVFSIVNAMGITYDALKALFPDVNRPGFSGHPFEAAYERLRTAPD